MSSGAVAGGHAVQDAAATGKIGRTLTLKIGQEDKTIGAGRNGVRRFFVLVVGPAEQLADLFGGDGDVHGAEQRQPRIGAVAEAGDFRRRDRSRDGPYRRRVSRKSRGWRLMQPGWTLAVPMAPIILSRAARADQNAVGQAPGGGESGLESADGLARGMESGKKIDQFGDR